MRGLKKEGEVIASRTSEMLQCHFCKHLVDESRIIKTKNQKLVCDECYDPADPEQQSSESEKLIPDKENRKEKTNNFNPFYTFTNNDTKTSENISNISLKEQKSIEILNIDELNAKIAIPQELKIIDCPPNVNSDPEWFRKQFRNFWRLFNNDSEWTFIIHDRGTGKSKQDAILILYNIAMFANFEGCFVMRNWDEPTRQTKEYFKKIINEFDYPIWQGERKLKDKSQWGLLWLSTYKGISFKKDIRDKAGELRCHFVDLFSPEQARTLINKPVSIIIFDECVPTKNQIRAGKGWKLDEQEKYMELLESLERGATAKKIFTGNPNDSFYNCWMLVQHFKKELQQLSKWYWTHKPKNFVAWLAWEWTKEIKKGNKTLQLKKVARKFKDFKGYEEDNWDKFFEKMEDLKIVDHKNGSEIQYIFNNCLCYLSKQNYFYFIDINSQEISERDRQLLSNITEYYVNDEQRLRSKQLSKWDKGKDNKFQQNLLRLYESNLLFFADMIAKERIETFIGKRKIIE